MGRLAILAVTGLLWAGYAIWTIVVDYQVPPPPGEWFGVILFSTVLLSLAVALPALVADTTSRWEFWGARIAAIGAFGAAVSNLLEDGLRINEAFFGFVGFLLLMEIGLIVLAGATIVTRRGTQRFLAAAPIGTLALLLLLYPLGGVVRMIGGGWVAGSWLMAAWLTAPSRQRD